MVPTPGRLPPHTHPLGPGACSTQMSLPPTACIRLPADRQTVGAWVRNLGCQRFSALLPTQGSQSPFPAETRGLVPGLGQRPGLWSAAGLGASQASKAGERYG